MTSRAVYRRTADRLDGRSRLPRPRLPARHRRGTIRKVLSCVECGTTSEGGRGWKAYLAGAVDEDKEEEDAGHLVALYCPECAEREFGGRNR